jgi:hypothetical protein
MDDDELFDETGSVEVPTAVMEEFETALEREAEDYTQTLIEHGKEYEAGELKGANRTPDEEAESRELARAFATDLEPLRERFSAILKIRDDVIMRTKLEALRADLEGTLGEDLRTDPQAARIIERLLAEGLRKGLTT